MDQRIWGFEERDPESTPTAVKKGEVRRFQFLHCDMFTFVFRHLFLVCVFGKDGMECDEFLIFLPRRGKKVLLQRRRNDLSRPFSLREISNPKFWVRRETADFLIINKGSLIAKQ